MTKPILTQDERKLLDDLEQGELHSTVRRKAESVKYRDIARAMFRNDKRVNIRISKKDLVGIQKRALAEGIP